MAFLQGPREALRTDEFDVVAELGPKADRVGVIVPITVDGLVAEASLFSLALFVVAINWLAEGRGKGWSLVSGCSLQLRVFRRVFKRL